MSKRLIGLTLSLLGSVALGVVAAQRFYDLFDKTVPVGVMTDLVRAGTHTAYVFSGVLFGLVIFGWTTAAIWLSRYFPATTK